MSHFDLFKFQVCGVKQNRIVLFIIISEADKNKAAPKMKFWKERKNVSA